MGGREPRRTDRIETRIAPEALAAIRRAAEIQGRSVSDFVAVSAQEAAHRVIEAAQIIRLSVEDQRRLADGLLAPSPPTEALRRAAAAHRRLTDQP